MSQVQLHAGFHQQDITPPAGLDMGGFALRPQPSAGIYDPLFTKALILDDGHTRVAIVSCDLLGFSTEYTDGLRGDIAATGIVSADHVLIACTHTHAGPATQFLRNCGDVNVEWMNGLRRRIIQAVEQAAKSLRPVDVFFAQEHADLNYDRRTVALTPGTTRTDPAAKIDRDTLVSVIQLVSSDQIVACLLHYACHPVVLRNDNNWISADFCGQATAYVEQATGAPAMFLNGACGNVDPITESHEHNSYDDVVTVGQMLGQIAVQATKQATRIQTYPLSASLNHCTVETPTPSPTEVKQAVEAAQKPLETENFSAAESWLAATTLHWAQAIQSGPETCNVQIPIQTFLLGPITIVGIGGEVFAATARKLRGLFGNSCLVVGYANGNIGYIPTRAAFERGGYEVDLAWKLYGSRGVGPDAEKQLLEAIRKQAASLGRKVYPGGRIVLASISMQEREINSTLDGTAQPFLLSTASSPQPRPLLVGLHTWSADRFNQIQNLAPLAAARDWHLALPEFRGPNLTTNPHCREACGSQLACQDVVDMVEFLQRHLNVSDIFLMGGSGGGHMALMLAAYRPALWTAVSSWCPITDVAAWHGQNPNYTPHIAACCGGVPGESVFVDAEYRAKSPIHHLDGLSEARVFIHHGKQDRSVPFTHTLSLYNRLLEHAPEAEVYCEIFDGGHDFFPERGLDWLASQAKSIPASAGTQLTH